MPSPSPLTCRQSSQVDSRVSGDSDQPDLLQEHNPTISGVVQQAAAAPEEEIQEVLVPKAPAVSHDDVHETFAASDADHVPLEDELTAGMLQAKESGTLSLAVNLRRQRKAAAHEDDHGHGHGAHGHGSKPHSIITAVMSGFINYLLMFGLCCAYGLIMFDDDFNGMHRALGVKLNLCTAFMVGLILAWKSKVAVAIGGPDLNPVVFIGGFVGTMSEAIADNVGLDFPETSSRRLQEESLFQIWRRLGGGGGGGSVDFCIPGGYHESKHMAECEEYHTRLRATSIFATAVTSAILGLIYFSLGRLKVTRLVSYVPTSVQEAFLSCIGYKVFKYALSFCNYKPLMFIPAACIGVTLYFCKSKHLGNPAIVIPSMVLSPLLVFYIIVFAAGLDIESMRTSGASDNWMFPKLDHVNFWELWTDSYGKADQIDFKAWVKTLPDLAIMLVVCVIDCLLKISSTESKLPVKVDKDYEASLYGMCNALTTVTGSSVGYMQLKFNVINYGVLGNTTDRRGGVVYALLCGACFFGTIGHFNFLPRFFLGILLFFAGAGFVAENLWGSRKYLSLAEWGEILAILAVFIFSGSLVAAVLVGVLVTCVSLILKYTRVSCIAGHPLPGGHITSSMERRNPLMMGQLSHIADSWFVVVRLKGYIFFASAQKMTSKIMQLVEERMDKPTYRRLQYIILDCEMLDGMDASAGKSVRKLLSDTKEKGVKLLWSHASGQFKKDLMVKEMLASPDHAFRTLVDAVLFIEDQITEYQQEIQSKWLKADTTFRMQHNLARFEADTDPWGSVLMKISARRGIPWRYCKSVNLKRCSTILWEPGEMDRGLFLIHTGKVALYSSLPEGPEADWPHPVAIYGHGWFVNRDFVVGKPTQHYAVAIKEGQAICWNRQLWWKMFSERPVMASELMKAVYAQSAVDSGSMRWLAELQVEDADAEIVEQVNAQNDEETTRASTLSSEQDALRYSEVHRALLPQQLKELIDGLEVAEAFGKFGAYNFEPNEEDGFLPGMLPPLPDSIADDLNVAFSTHCVVENGVKVLPSEQSMASLAYAGIPGVPVRYSAQKVFTLDEFQTLGHYACMSVLPGSVVKKLREILDAQKKKHAWRSRLQPHQVAILLREAGFPRSLNSEVVQGLMEEVLPTSSDEDIFLSVCSRLFSWYEQLFYLLTAVKKAASPDGTSTIFSKEALTKRLIDNHVIHSAEGSKEELQHMAESKASEMLWATDWPRRHAMDAEWGSRLHIYDAALAVLCQTSDPSGTLRPPPVEVKPDTYKQRNSRGSAVDNKPSKDVAKLVIHLPSLDESSSEFKTLHDDLATPAASGETSHDVGGFDRQASPDSMASGLTGGTRSSSSSNAHLAPDSLTWRQSIHITLEDPAYSTLSNWISLGMGVLILISIATMFIRPVVEHGREEDVTKGEEDVWFGFEFFLTAVFSVEYLIRLFVADALGKQTTFQFITAPANVCDFAAIIPFYIELAVDADAEEFRLLRVVRLLRLTRIARIGRLARRSELFPPIAMVLLVIWFIYMKTGLSDSK